MYYKTWSYPGEPEHVRLYMSLSVKDRLESASKYLRAHNWNVRQAYRLTRIHASVWNCLMRGQGMNLYSYFEIARYFGWNLLRDPNYYYANVICPPADLARRIERLFPDNYNLYAATRFIDDCLGYRQDTTWKHIYYSPGRDNRKFCEILKWIADGEYQFAWHDALDLED